MQIDIGATYDPQWYDFGDARLFIRPYPSSKSNLVIRDGRPVISGEDQWDIFNYCLVDWKNVTDATGATISCTEDIKKKVFDFAMAGISAFVLEKSRQFHLAEEDAEKNS